jgi:hypothetical protein
MIFTILMDVFENNSDYNIRMLDKFLHLSDERHSLYINDDDIIDSLMNSNWYLELRNSYKKQIEENIVRSMQSSKPKSVFTISNSDVNAFSTHEALVILEAPLKLILENIENDAYFIRALIKNFKKKSEKIKQHLSESWLKFDMGGGSTIPNVIRNEKQQFENNKGKFPKESHIYLRYFVLIDSDKNHPNAILNDDKKKLIQLLESNNIKYHVLEKREMENYMPDIVFSEIQGNQNYIKAYLDLESVQKDYFDIEKGFDSKYQQLPLKVQELYESVSDTNKEIFRKNKLDMIDSNGGKLSFKSNFPKLFQDCHNINQENLQARCGTNELKEILDKIEALL